MLKALVPVDGSPDSLGAVRHVIKLVKDREPLEIHLLNVQPPVHGDVTMFVSGSAVRANSMTSKPRKALAPARLLLDDRQRALYAARGGRAHGGGHCRMGEQAPLRQGDHGHARPRHDDAAAARLRHNAVIHEMDPAHPRHAGQGWHRHGSFRGVPMSAAEPPQGANSAPAGAAQRRSRQRGGSYEQCKRRHGTRDGVPALGQRSAAHCRRRGVARHLRSGNGGTTGQCRRRRADRCGSRAAPRRPRAERDSRAGAAQPMARCSSASSPIS